MFSRALHLILLAIGVSGAVRAAEPQYVAARDVVIEYGVANHVPVTAADLWVSTDAGQTWQEVADAGTKPGVAHYTAPNDGRYDFYLVLHGEGGDSSPPPMAGTEPVTTVVVDTATPLLQINDTAVRTEPDDRQAVAMQGTLVEENLSETGIHIFYRTDDSGWHDGGPVTFMDGQANWMVPSDVTTNFDIRLVVADRAGNQGTTEPMEIALVGKTAVAVAVDGPSSSPVSAGGMAPVIPPTVAPVEPPSVEPVTITERAEPPPSPASVPTSDDRDSIKHLRALATDFMREGRYSLAVARFEDALRLSPQDADLSVDLGSALYRQGQYDAAAARFESANTILPGHIGALDGLALVAATQKRYPQAREYLTELQRLQPDDGAVWLRSGDIEHRLGNTNAALQAWNKVLRVSRADAELRAKAQRRIDYFTPARALAEAGKASPGQGSDGTQGQRRSFDDRRTRR